jgi:hypothetical protein
MPIVKINGVAQTVGAEYLTDDGDVEVQWSYQEKYIRFTAGNFPAVNDVLEIIGKIEIPVIVRISNTESIANYGVWEFQIKDNTISTNDEAIERAYTELSSYANELNEGSFSTYTYGLKAGQILTINSASRVKDIQVIIQSVNAIIIDPTADLVKYDIVFATVKTLGIIEYLQSTLVDEDIIQDAQETLLNFFRITDSIEFDMQDTVSIETIFALSYTWTSGVNPLVWNFGSWGYQYVYGTALYGFSTWAE